MGHTVADRRRFLVGVLSDDRAPRLAPAMRAIRCRLLTGGWVPYADLIAAGLAGSQVKYDTLVTQIHGLVAAGFVERRGRWSHANDRREYRLIEWPMEGDAS
jgi:hypothetical protein